MFADPHISHVPPTRTPAHPAHPRPNVITTPHLGASTQEAQEGVSIEVVEAVVEALAGKLSANAVNAPMVAPEVLRELQPYVTLAEGLGKVRRTHARARAHTHTHTHTHTHAHTHAHVPAREVWAIRSRCGVCMVASCCRPRAVLGQPGPTGRPQPARPR